MLPVRLSPFPHRSPPCWAGPHVSRPLLVQHLADKVPEAIPKRLQRVPKSSSRMDDALYDGIGIAVIAPVDQDEHHCPVTLASRCANPLRCIDAAAHTPDLSSMWRRFHISPALSVRRPISRSIVSVDDLYCSAILRVAWYTYTHTHIHTYTHTHIHTYIHTYFTSSLHFHAAKSVSATENEGTGHNWPRREAAKHPLRHRLESKSSRCERPKQSSSRGTVRSVVKEKVGIGVRMTLFFNNRAPKSSNFLR